MGCVASRPAPGAALASPIEDQSPDPSTCDGAPPIKVREIKKSNDEEEVPAAPPSLLALAMDARSNSPGAGSVGDAEAGTEVISATTGPAPSSVILRAKQPFTIDDHQLDEPASTTILADVAYSMRNQRSIGPGSPVNAQQTQPLQLQPLLAAVKGGPDSAQPASGYAPTTGPFGSQPSQSDHSRLITDAGGSLEGYTPNGVGHHDHLLPTDPSADRSVPVSAYRAARGRGGPSVGQGQNTAMMPMFRGPAGVADGATGRGFPMVYAGRGPPLHVVIPPNTLYVGNAPAHPPDHLPTAFGAAKLDRHNVSGDTKGEDSDGDGDDEDDDDDDDLVAADDEVEDWDLEEEGVSADHGSKSTSVAPGPKMQGKGEAIAVAVPKTHRAAPPANPIASSPPRPIPAARGKFKPAFDVTDDIEVVQSDGDESSNSDDNDAEEGDDVSDWLDNDAPVPRVSSKTQQSKPPSRSAPREQVFTSRSNPSSARAAPPGQVQGFASAVSPSSRPIPVVFPAYSPYSAGAGPQPPMSYPPGLQSRVSPTRVSTAGGHLPPGPPSPVKQASCRNTIVSNMAPAVVPLAMVGTPSSPPKTAVSPTAPSTAIRDTKVVKKKRAQLPQHNLPHPVPKFGDWLNSRTMINNYIILESLGAGSYAEVKLCKEKISGKLFAMKFISRDIMKKDKLGKQSKLDDIKREIAIMKKLNHPNVLRLYEVMDDPNMNKLFLVLEYMKHGDLLSFQKKKQPNGVADGLPDRDLHCVFLQVILGLAYLHEQKIVHGDIKPQNLLVGDKDVVKIGDFGISQSLYGSKQKILDTAGTPAFMSPEMCSGEEYSGQLADIWAVGATFFMLKFGQPPFIAKSAMQIFEKIQNDPLVFPKPLDPSLQHLLTGMMTKNPQERLSLLEVMTHPWVAKDDTTADSLARHHPAAMITVSKDEIEHAVDGKDRFALIINTRAQMMKRLHQARVEVLERHRRLQAGTSASPTRTALGPKIVIGESQAIAHEHPSTTAASPLHSRSTPSKSSGKFKGNKVHAATSEAGQLHCAERQMLTNEEIAYRSNMFSRKKPSNKNTLELSADVSDEESGNPGLTGLHDRSVESDDDENFSSDDDTAVSQSPQLLDELLLTTLSMPPLSRTHTGHGHGSHAHMHAELHQSHAVSSQKLVDTDEQSFHGESPALGVKFGVASLQGRRNTQEDRWVVLPVIEADEQLGWQDAAYFGLYDGHGGEECANILHEQLHSWIFKRSSDSDTSTTDTLSSCFTELDSFVCDYLLHKGDLSGSTATSVILSPSSSSTSNNVHVCVGHVGDCRLVLAKRNGDIETITSDHRLDLMSERERILQLGGRVVNNRVNGVMAITRAFGDLEFKGLLDRRGHSGSSSSLGMATTLREHHNPFSNDDEKTPALLVARPDIHELELDPTVDELLVLACDGLWDVMTSEEAAEIARDRIRYHQNLPLAAKELAQEAIRRYSNDNITVILVLLEQLR